MITSPVMQQAQPVQLASQILTQAQTQSTPAPSSSRTAVLIVEDNLINQRLLRKLLTKHGYDTMVANNGEEALALLASSTWNPRQTRNISMILKIDIVLCDIEMPIMDGKTCVRRVRQLQQENLLSDSIPMIAITGNARHEQVEEMRLCGFDDVVTKPYKIDQLLSVIGHFVGTHGNSSPVAVS
jgi:CheY-like chemotaxis protein